MSEHKASWKAYLIAFSCIGLGLLLMLTIFAFIGLILIAWGTLFFLINYSVGFREIVFGIIGIRRARINPPLGATESVQNAIAAYSELERIVDVLQKGRLPAEFGDAPENEAEAWTSERLKDEFPNYRKQQDRIEVGDTRIEVRLPRSAEDFAILREQISVYLKHFRNIIAFIINYHGVNPQLIKDFEKDMNREHAGKVAVITRQWQQN